MTEVEDPPLGTPATQDAHTMTTGTGLDTVALDPNHITIDIEVTVDMNITKTAPGHSTDPPITATLTIGAPAHIATEEIHLIENLPLTTTLLKMTAYLNIAQRDTTTNQPRNLHLHHRHHPRDMGTGDTNKSLSITHHWNITVQTKVQATLRMI